MGVQPQQLRLLRYARDIICDYGYMTGRETIRDYRTETLYNLKSFAVQLHSSDIE